MNEKLVSPWREKLRSVLAASLLNAEQGRSAENRFAKLADLAASLEGVGQSFGSDSEDMREGLEDVNLATRTLLSMNLDIEQEVSTWALLAGSRPENAGQRIDALGLKGFSDIPGEWSQLPRKPKGIAEWHGHAGSRLRRLLHALLLAESFDDVVILMALADCELTRIAYVSTYALLES
ncbi:MAG: hypothetical protein R3268_04930 [Acidiferrobacterales bacterium]|nr:hypothetical protein [Acidiferrobacterales bacterium]